MNRVPTVLVCGGRKFNDYTLLKKALDQLLIERGWITEPDEYGNFLPNVKIIEGGMTGADDLANQYAVTNWCHFKTYEADWRKYGNAAGPIRNQKMLDEGKPDLVVAFPGGRGTADMVDRAKRQGYEVIEI